MLRYERPDTAARAASIVARTDGTARVLAGGTDLLLGLRAGTVRPEVLVDIKKIPGIDALEWTAEGELSIGAAVTMRRLAEDAQVREVFPALAEGAEAVGSFQIRCRATVGGNLANASPCMDTAPPLLSLGARVRLANPESEREVALSDFFLGVRRTALRSDEVLTAIVVPPPPHGMLSAFDKIKRVWGHDLALVNAAAAYAPGLGAVKAAVGSCGTTPIVLPVLDDVPPSSNPRSVGERLAVLALEHIAPIDDVRSGAEYRRDMTALLCHRLVGRLLAGARGRA